MEEESEDDGSNKDSEVEESEEDGDKIDKEKDEKKEGKVELEELNIDEDSSDEGVSKIEGEDGKGGIDIVKLPTTKPGDDIEIGIIKKDGKKGGSSPLVNILDDKTTKPIK